MRFKAVGVLAVLVGLVIAVPQASASTDSCRAAEKCTARTADTHVDKAVVKMDRDTSGRYRLTCSKGSQNSTQAGDVAEGERLVVVPELNNANCVLKGKGFSDGTARVRVSLVH